MNTFPSSGIVLRSTMSPDSNVMSSKDEFFAEETLTASTVPFPIVFIFKFNSILRKRGTITTSLSIVKLSGF